MQPLAHTVGGNTYKGGLDFWFLKGSHGLNLRGIIRVVLVRVDYSYWLLGDQKKIFFLWRDSGITKKKKIGSS